MQQRISTYEPILRAEVIYRILTDEQIEELAKKQKTLSVGDYKRLVIESVIDNLKPEVMSRLASLSQDQARKASQNLFRSAIMLNPLLDQGLMEPERQLVRPLDIKKVAGLQSALQKRIVGQEEAIEKVVSRIRQAAAGLTSPEKPRAVMMLAGPSGVGKTLLAKAIQDELFPGTRIVRIDCSEYTESHTRSRLIGSPPGYVGFDLGGQLTEEVRAHPNSVVLLDEVEKAHPNLFDLFLQVFDEGYLTDSKGEVADFTGSVIIMTSNIGTQKLGSTPLGFSRGKIDYRKMQEDVTEDIKKRFRVEFLGRVDEIVVFKPLLPHNLTRIAQMQLVELNKQMRPKGYQLSWTPKVLDWLVEKGTSSTYGAREISRIIARNIRDPLAEFVLTHKRGCVLKVEISKEGGEIRLSQKKTRVYRGQMKNPAR